MEQVHIILQARMKSMRLPGKALMPIAGLPSAILAARRAVRGGMPLTMATANDPSCTPLAAAATDAGFSVFRGSESDVLGRFAAATEKLPDGAIIVRLTADNIFPDSDFVEILVGVLRAKRADVVGTASAKGLPYGLSAEAFRLGALRQAAANATTPDDREHVTPWLYRNATAAPFDSLDGEFNLAGLRCTLDTADDYHALTKIFETVADPVEIGWRALLERLADPSADAKRSA